MTPLLSTLRRERPWRTVLYGGLLLFFLCAPLARGGEPRRAWSAMGLGLALLAAVWAAWSYKRGRVEVWKSPVYLGLLVLLCVALLHILPLGRFLGAVSPAGALRWEEAVAAGAEADARTISLFPPETRRASLLVLMALAAFFLTVNTFTTRRSLVLLALGLAGAATANALFGMVEQFSGREKTFWYLGGSPYAVTGTFLNKNHFALLLEMGVFVAVGLALAAGLADHRRYRDRDSARSLLVKSRPYFLFALLLSAVAMIVAVLFSFSRMGTSCVLMGLLLLAAAVFRFQGLTWKGIAPLAALAGALVFAALEGLKSVWGRFEGLASGESMSAALRWDLWKSSLSLLGEHSFAGVGLGAYAYTSPRYESGPIPGRIALHAHNDWLEFLCEAGILVGAGLLFFFLAIGIRTARRILARRDPVARWIGLGAIFAVFSVGAHELFDYGLRMPGNLFVFLGVAALATLCGDTPGTDGGAPSPHLFVWRLGRQSGILFLLAGLALPAGFAWLLLPELRSGFPLARLEARLSERAPAFLLPPEEEARYRVELAGEALFPAPDTPTALMVLAEETARLANLDERKACADILSAELKRPVALEELEEPKFRPLRREAASRMDEEARERIGGQYEGASRLLGRACGLAPTNGHFLALFGQARERIGLFWGGVEEGAVREAFRLAHASYPRAGPVTRLCGQGAWRRYLRLAAASSPEERSALQEALGLFREALEQSPDASEEVFRTVWDVSPRPEVLTGLAPRNIRCLEALYRFLFQRRSFEACLEVLRAIDRLTADRPSAKASHSVDPFTFFRQDWRPKEIAALSVPKREIFILGLLERWTERRACLDAFQAALSRTEEAELALAREYLARGRYHAAETHLERILQTDPHNAPALLEEARVRNAFGDGTGAVRMLLPLVYEDLATDRSLFEEALKFLAGMRTGPAGAGLGPPPFPVAAFVRAGLLLKLGQSEEGEKELLLLLQKMREGEVGPWLQEPLAHFCLGQAQEARGAPIEALRSHGRALLLCPHHLGAAQSSARLLRTANALDLFFSGDPEENERLFRAVEDARVWLRSLRPLVPLETDFGGRLELLGYSIEPRILLPGGFFRATFYWYCNRDIDRDYSIVCRYLLGDELVFSYAHAIGDDGGEMTGWRVGEVAAITRQVSPTELAARQEGQRARPGCYDLEVTLRGGGTKAERLQPNVACRAPAFVIVSAASPEASEP
ncbi:MAG: O-antigen ligase family protein [Planctomycetota bacterium]